jgi:hypothetical protein
MSRFVVVDILPSQEAEIINLDAISILTVVTEPSGTKNLKIHMMDGADIVIAADFAAVETRLLATPL